MPALTEEIIRIVLDIIYNKTISPPWRTLTILTLVCHAWSIHAQTLLFSYVYIDKPYQLDSFLFATNPATDRGRRLSNAVKIIKVLVHPPSYINRVPITRLPELLSRCPRLYELNLTLEEVYIISDELLEQMRKSTPPILALRIRDSMTKGTSARQLLHVWPSVRHLVLRSSSAGLHAIYDDEPSPSFQLYEFRYEGNHPQSVRFLHWLFRHQYERPRPESHLRILHLSVPLADDTDAELGAHYGRHLHSLRLLCPDLPLIQSSVSLRELYLRHDEDITEGLLICLPHSMEHIACTTQSNRTTAVEKVLKFRELGQGLKSLRAMTLYCPQCEVKKDWESRWGKLCARARRAGFDLIRQDDRSFLVGGSEDLLAAELFPRLVSVRQFKRMEAAMDSLPAAYSVTEEEATLQRPRAQSPLPSRPPARVMPYTRRNSSQTTLELGRPIVLDQAPVLPHRWVYEDEDTQGPIILDDPKSQSRQDIWTTARSSFRAFRQRLGRDES